jgi:hypothetical protein
MIENNQIDQQYHALNSFNKDRWLGDSAWQNNKEEFSKIGQKHDFATSGQIVENTFAEFLQQVKGLSEKIVKKLLSQKNISAFVLGFDGILLCNSSSENALTKEEQIELEKALGESEIFILAPVKLGYSGESDGFFILNKELAQSVVAKNHDIFSETITNSNFSNWVKEESQNLVDDDTKLGLLSGYPRESVEQYQIWLKAQKKALLDSNYSAMFANGNIDVERISAYINKMEQLEPHEKKALINSLQFSTGEFIAFSETEENKGILRNKWLSIFSKRLLFSVDN